METLETLETLDPFDPFEMLDHNGIVVLEPTLEYTTIEDLLSKLPFNEANRAFIEMHKGGEQYNIGLLNDSLPDDKAARIASGSFNTIFSKGELGIRKSKAPYDIDDIDDSHVIEELNNNQDIWLSLNSVRVTPELYFYGLLKYRSKYYLIIVNKLYRNNLSDFIHRLPLIRGSSGIDPDKGWYTRLKNRFIEIYNKLTGTEEEILKSKKYLKSLHKKLFDYIDTQITRQLKDLVIITVNNGIFCSDIKTLNIVIDHHFDTLIDMLSKQTFIIDFLSAPRDVFKSLKNEAKMDIKFIDVDYTEINVAGCKKNVSKIRAELTRELSLYTGIQTRRTYDNQYIRALSKKFPGIREGGDIETLSLIVIIFLKLILIANHLFNDGNNVLAKFFKDNYGPSILQMWTPGEQSEDNFVYSLLPFLEILLEKTKVVTDEIYFQQLWHYFGLGINEISPYNLYSRAISVNDEDKAYIEWMSPLPLSPPGKRKQDAGGKKSKKKSKKKTKKKRNSKKYYKRNTFNKKKKKTR